MNYDCGRSIYSNRETAGLNSQGLSKLQEFNIMSLLKGEAFALGAAVRELLNETAYCEGCKIAPCRGKCTEKVVYGLVKRNRNGFPGSLAGDGLWVPVNIG